MQEESIESAATVVTQNGGAEDQIGPMPVVALEGHGIAAGDVKKLRDAGYNTIESLVYAPRKNLLAVKGISEAKADKIISEAQKLVPTGFTTATEMHMKRANMIQVRKFSKLKYSNVIKIIVF